MSSTPSETIRSSNSTA